MLEPVTERKEKKKKSGLGKGDVCDQNVKGKKGKKEKSKNEAEKKI